MKLLFPSIDQHLMNAHPSCLLSWILKIAVIRSQYYLSLLFSVPAIPWTEVLSGLQSSGSQRAGQDWMTKHSLTPSEVMLVSIMFAAASAWKLFVSCYSRVTGIWGFPAWWPLRMVHPSIRHRGEAQGHLREVKSGGGEPTHSIVPGEEGQPIC